MIGPMVVPWGYMVSLAEAVKRAVNVPVATVGRIPDPVFANEIVRSGEANLVDVRRAW